MATQTVQLKYLRMAPRKVRAVAGVIRGMSVNEAEAQLVMSRRRAAKPLLKLLRSAITSAKQNQKLDANALYVRSVRVDQGPMVKRYLPRARGRATEIQKKMSHVHLELAQSATPEAPRFMIARPKKTKLPPGSERRKKKEQKKPKMHDQAREKKPDVGFLRRVFSRKAGMGK